MLKEITVHTTNNWLRVAGFLCPGYLLRQGYYCAESSIFF